MEKISNLTNHKIFGVFLSGGLDSALLAYLVLELLPESKVVCLTGTHKHMNYYNIENSKNIVSWLNEKFPDRIIKHIITKYIDRTDANFRKKSVNKEFIKKYNIDALCTGMTINPLNEPSLMIEGRDKRRDTELKYKSNYHDIAHYMPFHQLDKKGIKNLYDRYNIDELAKLTVSCETENLIRPCKSCWWCKEKFWAFNYY